MTDAYFQSTKSDKRKELSGSKDRGPPGLDATKTRGRWPGKS